MSISQMKTMRAFYSHQIKIIRKEILLINFLNKVFQVKMSRELTYRKLPNQGPSASKMF